MEAAVKALASADSATREQGFAYLRDQGRYVEPMLRRTLNATEDAKTRTLCRRLLLTGWVFELRSTSPGSFSRNSDKTGDRLPAELIALLRNVKP